MVLCAQEGKMVESFEIPDLEEAIAWYWTEHVATQIAWESWGEDMHAPVEGQTDLSTLARPPIGFNNGNLAALDSALGIPSQTQPVVSSGYKGSEDIVVQARQNWLSSQTPEVTQTQGVGKSPLPKQPKNGNRQNSRNPEWDPVSGLEVREPFGDDAEVRPMRSPALRGPQPQHQPHAGVFETAAGDAELVVSAPEFNEEFGSLPEHTEDPLTGVCLTTDSSHVPAASLPRWLEKHRPKHSQRPHQAAPVDRLAESRARLAEDRNFAVVESLFDEIDQFEKANLPTQGDDGAPLDDSDDDGR